MRQLWIDVEVGNLLPGASRASRDGELLGNSGGKDDRSKKDRDYIYSVYMYICMICIVILCHVTYLCIYIILY